MYFGLKKPDNLQPCWSKIRCRRSAPFRPPGMWQNMHCSAIAALYRNMPVRVYNDTPASDVSVQFNHGILPCPAGVVELEVVFLTTCHVARVTYVR